ncbi:hypothetical protein RvY_00190 [Ramazzottius varieornatus]|uniref:Uncharacterized protein n=1 Tax=Ramazzottius varieornatus TaxID=947166 RepID=A0A1D1ULT8_RAMVA|nr:hypothetical protein RvY_00190 [Ramazzottius varieornatus]
MLRQSLSYGNGGLLEAVSALKAASAGSSKHPLFLLGTSAGDVYYLDQQGKVHQGPRLQGSVQAISFLEIFGSKYWTAYFVMDSLNVLGYQISHGFVFEETFNAACPGKTPVPSVCWLNPEVLAIATGENHLRIWDCLKSANIDLPLHDFAGTEPAEALRTVTLNQSSGVLMGQTNSGKLLFWSSWPSSSSQSFCRMMCSTLWSLISSFQVRLSAADISGPSFAIADTHTVYVLQQRPLSFAFTYPLLAIQTSTKSVSIIDEQRKKAAMQKVKFQISGVAVKDNLLVVWSEETVSVWQMSAQADDEGLTLTEISTFRRDYAKIAIYNGALVATKNKSINFLTAQGVVKADIKVLANEGTVALMDIKGSTCVVAVSEGYLKTFNLDTSDPKSWNKTKAIKEAVTSYASFKSLSINLDCLYIAFLTDRNDGVPEDKVYLWDLERNAISWYSFDSAVPSQVTWQSDDPRQLAVNLTCSSTWKKAGNDRLAFFFASSDKGLVLANQLPLKTNGSALLLGTHSPFAFVYANSVEQGGKLAVIKRFLPDCEGFVPEHKDDMMAIADFGYYAALGHFSRAINSVKTTSNGVWNHLARLCVKRGKLEYAKVCLGKLGHVAILADIRNFAETNHNTKAQLGRLAALLHIKGTADEYFGMSGQTDLSDSLRKACGDFATDEKHGPIDGPQGDVISTSARLKQRGLLYEQAQHEKAFADVEMTVEKLKKAKCEKFDVPRFLLQKRPQELHDYIDQANDTRLYGWYGHFLESQNLTDEAVEYYEKAHELKAQVRIFCGRDEQDAALALVRRSHNRAAAFQLAHAMEVEGKTDATILVELYEMAGAYRNAIRICMDNELDEEVVKLALQSQKSESIMAAKYLQSKGLIDKAITLYHSAGRINKATDLAFTQGYYGNIETISVDINENSDPRLIERCVEYFAEHKQVDRAVNLLIKAKRVQHESMI